MVKKNKLFWQVWFDELYGGAFCLLIGPADKVKRWLKAHFELTDEEVNEDNWDVGARTTLIEHRGADYIVFWFPSFNPRKNGDMSLLAHECFHATQMTLSTIGLKLSRQSDEAYAYYIQWIFKRCLDCLR